MKLLVYMLFIINVWVIMFSVKVAILGTHELDNVCVIMCLFTAIMNLVLTFKL